MAIRYFVAASPSASANRRRCISENPVCTSAMLSAKTENTEWNKVATSVVGKIAGLKPVTIILDEYLTWKGLDGLFLKIAEEEKKIRLNPVARVTELLKRVCGAKV